MPSLTNYGNLLVLCPGSVDDCGWATHARHSLHQSSAERTTASISLNSALGELPTESVTKSADILLCNACRRGFAVQCLLQRATHWLVMEGV